MKHIIKNSITDVSVSSENTNFPAERMLDDKPKRVCKARAGEWTQEITADVPGGCDCVMLAGTNAKTATVRARDPNEISWGGDDRWGFDIEYTVSELTASDAQARDYFGTSCALSADGAILAVGAYAEDTAASNAGKVYVYDWSGSAWVERGTITASDAAASDYFGTSCALSADGTILAVGAYAEDTADGNAGKVYVYDWSGSTWVERGMLTASDAQADDSFGWSCALSSDGTILAVGSRNEDTAAGDAGKVYVYDWSGSAWLERGMITASDAQAADLFGSSCALSSDGTILVVGASYEDTAASNAGKVYVYDWSGSAWVERGTITASDAQAADLFGSSCALSADGAILVVGAYTEDTAASNAGKVYVYDWSGSAWVERGTITATDAAASDLFGSSCALSSDGTILVVGAFTEGTAASDAGKVYIHNITGQSVLYEWANTPLDVSGNVTQDATNRTLWIDLSESINRSCELTISATGPASETIEIGVVTACLSEDYGGRNPRYGISKTQLDYSIEAVNSNGSLFYRDRDRVRTFSLNAIMLRADSRKIESFFRTQGKKATGWKLTDLAGNDFVVFGRMIQPPQITDDYPNHSSVSWQIQEVI